MRICHICTTKLPFFYALITPNHTEIRRTQGKPILLLTRTLLCHGRHAGPNLSAIHQSLRKRLTDDFFTQYRRKQALNGQRCPYWTNDRHCYWASLFDDICHGRTVFILPGVCIPPLRRHYSRLPASLPQTGKRGIFYISVYSVKYSKTN
jgi:hypothetical protein